MAKKLEPLILPQSRLRNPLLVPGLTRRAGPHGTTRKAEIGRAHV